MIAGLRDWAEHGLIEPDQVVKATAEYRNDSDPLGRFLAACTAPDEGGRIQASELHKTFVAWAAANGEAPWKATGFGRAMGDRGYQSIHSDKNFWLGLKLIRRASDFVDAEGRPLRITDEDEMDDFVPA